MSTATANPETSHVTGAAETLELGFTAVRVSFCWWGTSKTLTEGQKEDVAHTFDADRHFLSARKKLIDTRHSSYKPVAKVKRDIVSFWKLNTLPFPEPGIRLLPHSKLSDFEEFMQKARANLAEAVEGLQDAYADIRHKAEHDLGSLFSDGDYPSDLRGLFSVSHNIENVSAPDYLLTLRPDLYDREVARVKGLFSQAVDLAEQAFTDELSKLVANLRDRMTPGADGMAKVFGDGCVDNLKAFIGRFRELSVKSNDDLEKLVTECDNLTRGVSAEQFRGLPELRTHLAEKLGEVQEQIEKNLQVAPRRRITRRPATPE